MKYRGEDQLLKMHQLDPVLMSLDAEKEHSSGPDEAKAIAAQIKERETLLLPLYLQVFVFVAVFFLILNPPPLLIKLKCSLVCVCVYFNPLISF